MSQHSFLVTAYNYTSLAKLITQGVQICLFILYTFKNIVLLQNKRTLKKIYVLMGPTKLYLSELFMDKSIEMSDKIFDITNNLFTILSHSVG